MYYTSKSSTSLSVDLPKYSLNNACKDYLIIWMCETGAVDVPMNLTQSVSQLTLK